VIWAGILLNTEEGLIENVTGVKENVYYVTAPWIIVKCNATGHVSDMRSSVFSNPLSCNVTCSSGSFLYSPVKNYLVREVQ
jgi:hypothetical protein